jgi:predicted Rossmann fold nucleotide-binding protein DprA/Smf involved in DNA uptake
VRSSDVSLNENILSRILDKVPIDEIAREPKSACRRAAPVLLDLELKGLVCQLVDKYVISV